MGAVRRLIEQVPDAAIRTLETALAAGAKADASLAQVRTLVGEEMLDRRTRAMVLGPVLPLCAPPSEGAGPAFPARSVALTWRGLKITSPDEIAQALRAFATHHGDDGAPPVFDELCRRAARGIREDSEAFQPVAALLGPDRSRAFADTVSLVPLARRALEKLPVWVRTLSSDHAAALRLAFRDAAAVSEDAGPPFIEILFAHLQEPYEILRLISLVMDHPSDSYLAASELASFGERLLDDLERRIEAVRHFDPDRGLEAGAALASSVQYATIIIAEFEKWLALNRDGPWGLRVFAGKKALATAVEGRFKEIEHAVGAALPSQPSRSGGKKGRGPPRLAADPDLAATTRARALLAFLCETRSSAGHGGFGAMRSRVIEALDPRIDNYAEDLLDHLHQGDAAPPQRIRAYLEITAEFLGLVRDPKAAEIIRRRTAVA